MSKGHLILPNNEKAMGQFFQRIIDNVKRAEQEAKTKPPLLPHQAVEGDNECKFCGKSVEKWKPMEGCLTREWETPATSEGEGDPSWTYTAYLPAW